jgi:hypothetical protein
VTIQELVFDTATSAMPWVPENATGYDDWSLGENEFGTFIHEGERFGFVRIAARDEYSHYLVGVFPEGDELEALKGSAEVSSLFNKYLSESDRQAVHIFKDAASDQPADVNAYFSYGPRYCKPCIICSKQLETVDATSDHVVDQPHGGTNFSTKGHYGSTVFDPNGSEHLSINICDECLKLKAAQGVITHVKERQRVVDESVRTDWEPYSD